MARPKKEELSPHVVRWSSGRKRGNPHFVSSSFYVPKKTNLRFDRSILTLKERGVAVDRSDVLSALMELFNREVDAVEEQEDGELSSLDEMLSRAKEGILQVTADTSMLKLLLLESLAELKVKKQEQDEALAIAIRKLQQEVSPSSERN